MGGNNLCRTNSWAVSDCPGRVNIISDRSIVMFWISFGKWERQSGRLFTMKRVYYNRYRWTPFVKLSLRKGSVL